VSNIVEINAKRRINAKLSNAGSSLANPRLAYRMGEGGREGGNFWECFDFHAFRAITVCSILGVRRSVRTERLLVGYKKTKKKKDEENMMKAQKRLILTHACRAQSDLESSSSTRYSSQTFRS